MITDFRTAHPPGERYFVEGEEGLVLSPGVETYHGQPVGDPPALAELRQWLEHDACCPAFFEPTNTCSCGLAQAIARAAVDEAMGPAGPGPFAPTYRVEGGSTRPVIHSEEAGFERRPLAEGLECAAIGSAYERDAGGRPVHVGDRKPWVPPEHRRLEAGSAESGGRRGFPDGAMGRES